MFDDAFADKDGYDDLYKDDVSDLIDSRDISDYVDRYEKFRISEFFRGGNTKGYVRGEATRMLIEYSKLLSVDSGKLTVLDAGCGQGELSVYLACLGYNVIGIDISEEGCRVARLLADNVGVSERCKFLAESLSDISIKDESVDVVVGHASLHHFIKYKNVSKELWRVMKVGAEGYFADSFGENSLYRLFHDKEKMARLGDVILTKKEILTFFCQFRVQIFPTDWFVMLDKLYLKLLPGNLENLVRKVSRIHFMVDRMIPRSSRISLFLSGAIVTVIKKVV